MLLDQRIAFVTGAGSGIGRAGAHAMAAEGARVIVTDLDGDRASHVADEIRVAGGLAEALALVAKADGIVFADVPPTRMNDDPSFWLCKFCSYWAVCHGCKIPEVNCRTCANSTPERDGEWSCTKHGKALGVCTDHLFIPPMMPKGWEVLDASPDRVVYHDEEGEVIANEGNSEALFEGRQQ